MKTFQGWLNLLVGLLVVALVVFRIVASITGDGTSDTETRIAAYGCWPS